MNPSIYLYRAVSATTHQIDSTNTDATLCGREVYADEILVPTISGEFCAECAAAR